MQISLSVRYLLAFVALAFLVSELHEQAHIQTGYLLFGGYGPRDFNVWQLRSSADADARAGWASAAGPLFSYTCMWVGVYLLRFTKQRVWGISLLFAALPFARIFTALMGGGDETIIAAQLWGSGTSRLPVRVMASGWVLLVCLPPLLLAYRSLAPAGRWWRFVLLLLLPMLAGMVLTHHLLNRLLASGFLSTVYAAGSPLLVQLFFVCMLLLFWLCRDSLQAEET